jgi:dTDP-4-dehydrorhamnose 3,5-epimerase
MEEIKTVFDFEQPRIIPCKLFSDNRGWLYEAYNQNSLDIDVKFIQDNHSYSEFKGTIRGLHIQKPPYDQAKLIRVLKGKIFDVVVDLRPASENYLQIRIFELNSINKDALFIPKGFAHGFMTLEDHTEVYYKVDQIYSKDSEITIIYRDPALSIKWPSFSKIILSEKDSKGIVLEEAIRILKEEAK